MLLDATRRRRRRVARLAERSAAPEKAWVGRGPRYLVQPRVTRACAPSLQAIAATLRDDSRPVDPRQVASVEAFLLAFDTPFRGFDASAACRAAAILEDEIVGGHVVPRHVTVIAA